MTFDLLRKYLLSGVVFSGAEGGGGSPDDVLDPDPEDDEQVDDPAGEGDQDDDNEDDPDAGDDDDDDAGADAAGVSDDRRGTKNQYSRLRETNRELARRDAENTRRLAELEERLNRGPQHFQPQETPQQREARLSLLSPDERYQTEMREFTQGMQQQMQQLRQQTAAQSDRAHFASIAARNRVAQRYTDEVEKRFGDFQRQGVYVERHVILKNLLGEKVLAQAEKGEKKRPAENRRRQAARPQRGASDAPSNRRGRGEPGSAADYEERFGDVPI
jgi:hypothetical protein